MSMCALATAAEEQLPPGVEDPFGLGPRLALDHLQEAPGITMPPGSDWATVLARYQALPRHAGGRGGRR